MPLVALGCRSELFHVRSENQKRVAHCAGCFDLGIRRGATKNDNAPFRTPKRRVFILKLEEEIDRRGHSLNLAPARERAACSVVSELEIILMMAHRMVQKNAKRSAAK
jgi:hypothetical protein